MRSLVAALPLLLAPGLPATEAPTPPHFRVYTREAGIHRVTFDQLRAAGLATEGVPSGRLSLETADRTVPLRLRDGGDGVFGPGDSFEFAAEILGGATTHYHPYSPYNVYWLRWRADAARRLPDASASLIGAGSELPVDLRRRVHMERDELLIRLSRADVADDEEPELWYWAKVTSHRDSRPFRLDLDLHDALPDRSAKLRVGLRGLSSLPASQRSQAAEDHAVRLMLDGRHLTDKTWSGKGPLSVNRAALSLAGLARRGVPLEVDVKRRKLADSKVVDVVMIDFVELEYGHNGLVGAERLRIEIQPGPRQQRVVELVAEFDGRLLVVGRELGMIERDVAAGDSVRFRVPERESSLWLTSEEGVATPVAVEADAPSDLRSYGRQVDYLLIAHGSLLEATEGLASLHRARGLSVERIDVQDIYDEFNGGIASPTAIRAFVAHAYHNWRPPRPRFVLLVGDASWDTKHSTVDEANYANWVGQQLFRGDRFVAKDTADYDEARRNDRNLIPSWNHHTFEGHAASDAYYTLVDEDDDLPDLAIGRLPVATPGEVAAITAKIRGYVESAPLGPWRSHLVWISGALLPHQMRSRTLADEQVARGMRPTLILPGETARPEDRARIVEALDTGSLVTHFIGHGGRFIWRTGPPDLSDQVDLFDLEDLERLTPSAALPVVLSVACYSAPFDHPSADSIGEAFLRLPDRGALAFIGASWRNAPPMSLSRYLVEELSRPGTVGEALMRAKRRVDKEDVTHLFNLLGDPAVPIAAPQRTIDVVARREESTLIVELTVPEAGVGGRVVLDHYDAEGNHLDRRELTAESSRVVVRREIDPEVKAIAVYFWNETTGVDGAGGAVLDDPEVPVEATEAG